MDYTKGEKVITKHSYSRYEDIHSIKVSITEGEYNGQLKKRSYKIEIPASQKATKVRVNGESIRFKKDKERKINKIAVKSKSIKSEIVIDITAKNSILFGLTITVCVKNI